MRTATVVTALTAILLLAACSPVSTGRTAPDRSTTSSVTGTTDTAVTESTSTTEPETPPVDAAVPSAEKVYREVVVTNVYRSWDKAPGFSGRKPGTGPHGARIQVFVNEVVANALASSGQGEWPVGAKIMKDGFDSSGKQVKFAYMHKTREGWYFAEWDQDGKVIAQGVMPSACAPCHRAGTDHTRSFRLP